MRKKTIQYIEVRFETKALFLTHNTEKFSLTSQLAYLLLKVVIDANHRNLPLPKAYSIEGVPLEHNDLSKNVSSFKKEDKGVFILETNTSDDHKLKTKYHLSPEILLCYFSGQDGAQKEVQELIVSKASVNPTYYLTEPFIAAPPLLMAAITKNTSTIQHLLAYKADTSSIAKGKNSLDFLIQAKRPKLKAIRALLMAGAKPHHELPDPDNIDRNVAELLSRAGIIKEHYKDDFSEEEDLKTEDYKQFFFLPLLAEVIRFKLYASPEFYENFSKKLPVDIIHLIMEYSMIECYTGILKSPTIQSAIARSKTYYLEEIMNYLKTNPTSQHAKWLNHLIEVLDQPNFYSRELLQPLSMPDVVNFHLSSFIRSGGILLKSDSLYSVLEKTISKEILDKTIEAGQKEYGKSIPISKALAKRDSDNYRLFCELTDCKKMPTGDFKVSDFSQRLLPPPIAQTLVNKIKANLATALHPWVPRLKPTAPQIMQDLKKIMTLKDFLLWSNNYQEKVLNLASSLAREERESVMAACRLINTYRTLALTPIHPVSTMQDSYCSVM